MTVGERIRAARLALDLSSQDVADQLDVTRACVTNWEAGISTPGAGRLRDVARVLKMDLGDLVPK